MRRIFSNRIIRDISYITLSIIDLIGCIGFVFTMSVGSIFVLNNVLYSKSVKLIVDSSVIPLASIIVIVFYIYSVVFCLMSYGNGSGFATKFLGWVNKNVENI